ncbi:MAG: hypothetical protein ACK4OI_05930, partial [Rhizobium oryzihabitans]
AKLKNPSAQTKPPCLRKPLRSRGTAVFIFPFSGLSMSPLDLQHEMQEACQFCCDAQRAAKWAIAKDCNLPCVILGLDLRIHDFNGLWVLGSNPK